MIDVLPLLCYLAGLVSWPLATWFGNRLRDQAPPTEVIPPAPSTPVTYVDAIADQAGATWLDQVVGALADADELVLAHEVRRRTERAIATLRALARPDVTGSPCWCSKAWQVDAKVETHSRACTTAAATVAQLTAPPFPRATVVPDLDRYRH